jgi:hypothetical protein
VTINHFTNLFYIKTKSKKELYLTSSPEFIEFEGNMYKPFSGLSVESGEFNDSAVNILVLHGVFEAQGIDRNQELEGATIRIMSIDENGVDELVTYICTKQILEDLEFKLICEPSSVKFNQSLLSSFSKTCRANFCDSQCKLEIKDFKPTFRTKFG